MTIEAGHWTLTIGGGWRVYSFAKCDPTTDECACNPTHRPGLDSTSTPALPSDA